MKILIAPNSLKGSPNSIEFTKAISKALKNLNSDLSCLECPIADGEDGLSM
ncbi:MAG: hypothetical protein FJW91_06240 [Actinobacteria bacterium]|nr:hypothetical protein [Actinomycetota bacterium]